MKDWLNEWYNDQFEKMDRTPSSEVWDNISRSMEDWPKHWYSSNVRDLNTQPRPSTWEQLNKDLVKDRNIRRANRVPYVAASILAVLLMSVPLYTGDQGNSWVDIGLVNKNLSKHYGGESDADVKIAESYSKSSHNEEVDAPTESSFPSKRNEIIRLNEDSGAMSVTSLSLRELDFETATMNTLTLAKSNKPGEELQVSMLPVRTSKLTARRKYDYQEPKKSFESSKYQLSLSLLPQLSMLNNPLTQNALNNENESLSVEPSTALQVAFQHNFDQRNGLKFAALLNNEKSLHSVSDNSTREISLTYFSLAALYTSRWSFKRSPRLSFQTDAGIVASYTNEPSVRFNAERIDYLETGFSKFDIGAYLGASIQTRISNHWSVLTGIQSQVGLINIFEGNEFVPKNYFKTSTQSIGFNLGVIYSL